MITGKLLRDAFVSSAYVIAEKKRSVDELNVYPVPDGDTGTNMSMTMGNAIAELLRMPDSCTVSEVAETTAACLLRGARGNSGVILSLLFRGFSKGFAGLEEADSSDLIRALEIGVKAAYKAVMKPTEGTILTVARLSYEAVEKSSDEPITLWNIVVSASKVALEDTPNQLDVLKRAGVVDAGGMGLVIIFEEMLRVFSGGEPRKKIEATDGWTADGDKSGNATFVGAVSVQDFSSVVGEFDEVINFTYCTEFIVRKNADCPDETRLRAFLETIGDCVVAVSDDDIIKVHVHTDHPGKAIEEGLLFGSLINLKIDNMRFQHENKAREAALVKETDFVPATPEKDFGFAVVSSGRGIEELFKNLGADTVITGGQTMNPSTDDILKAILATPAHTVFVLPNNKNIIMAAEQAGKLADREVCVIPTRFIPQGITAMMNFDPDADFETNRMNMIKALDNVRTGQVTFAARNSDIDGKEIKQGEILALDNGKMLLSDTDINKAAGKLIKHMSKKDTAFITIIYGSDIDDEKASALETYVKNRYSDADVMLVSGGQPVYYYIISVE
ncbi:MAG: DAK2 domain-containing protein [Ruminococcus sp.]|jgi:DAK2 domain fusion protein YloV|nr:DAK2 domain-containing protein [Ruminococcus sp.]